MSGIKDMLRKFPGQFEHWLIDPSGTVCDLFKSITMLLECTPEWFFEFCVSQAGSNKNDRVYHDSIRAYADSVVFPEFEYSNVYAIKNVVERIPSGSRLHLSINDAIRITNFFKIDPGVKVYANIGTHGIDGCMSSLLGQARMIDENCYLIIGDLAFFYDMNAFCTNDIKNNVRILLLNNQGGEEFYYNGVWKNEASDLHTTARHNTKAGEWVKENDFRYLPVYDRASFEAALPEFMAEHSECPILMEVFTEMRKDSQVIFDFYDLSRPRDLQSEVIRKSKEIVKRTIGQEKAQAIVGKFLKK